MHRHKPKILTGTVALHHHDELMKYLLQSGKYSDLTISCRDREFSVHRAIVCPRCPHFAAACGDFLEGRTGRITLGDDDPDTVERMISYLYTLDYEDEECAPVQENQEQAPPALFSSVRVYAIADKYIISSLKELAKERFSKWAASNWSHPDFPIVVREVCQSTPSSDRGLRDVVSKLLGKHTALLDNDDFSDATDLFGEFGLGVVRQVVKHKNEMELRIKTLEEAMAQQAGPWGEPRKLLAKRF
ncbi:MAG: hypothetical protein M1840_001519 [Geoglossum simile]|nr:MAG: hypothetical protein M1840_001519 [Geoglossum simile]